MQPRLKSLCQYRHSIARGNIEFWSPSEKEKELEEVDKEIEEERKKDHGQA